MSPTQSPDDPPPKLAPTFRRPVPIPSLSRAPAPSPSPDRPSPPRTPNGNGAHLLEPPSPTTTPGPPDAAGSDDAPQLGADDGSARTTTSSASSERRSRLAQHEVAATVSSLLAILAGLGAWLARRRRWELRPPDEDERAAVADPVASILVRHAGVEWLSADMVDVVRASAGVATYVQTDPLYRVGEPDPDPAGPGADPGRADLTPAPMTEVHR